MYKFKAYGRDITISDEDMNLLNKFWANMNDITCQHYLDVYFVYRHKFIDTKKEIGQYSDDELSKIVVDIAKQELVVSG